MSNKLELELVTPEQLVTSREAGMVVVPGGEGDFGVLVHHAPMIATVRPGVVDVYDDDRITDRFFVAGGFAEVTATRCTVLAEEAVPVAEITREMADGAVADARARYQSADTDTEREVAQRALAAAEVMRETVAA